MHSRKSRSDLAAAGMPIPAHRLRNTRYPSLLLIQLRATFFGKLVLDFPDDKCLLL